MIQLPITPTPAEPTVESLKQRIDDLEAFILDFMNMTVTQLKEAIALGADSNATAKRILDRLTAADMKTTQETKSQIM